MATTASPGTAMAVPTAIGGAAMMATPSQPGAHSGGVVMASAFPLESGSDKHQRLSRNGFPPNVHDGPRPNPAGQVLGCEPDPDPFLSPFPKRALL